MMGKEEGEGEGGLMMGRDECDGGLVRRREYSGGWVVEGRMEGMNGMV